MMLVVDTERSEHGPQRRKANSGRLLHCCCICGNLDTWGHSWFCFCSVKELDDEVPIAKFCSRKCQNRGGPNASNVTAEMKQNAKDAEWRAPDIAYRPATDREKYADAAYLQQRTTNRVASGDRRESEPPLPSHEAKDSSPSAIRSPGAALGPPREGRS